MLITQEEAIKEWKEFVQNAKKSGYIFPTGIITHDRLIGGFIRTTFGVIGARTGVGKSAAMLYMSNLLADLGYNVVYLSLEQEIVELLNRLACIRDPRIKLRDLHENGLSSELVDKLVEKINFVKLPMKWGYLTDWVEIEEIISSLEVASQTIVFIDYVGRIKYRGLSAAQADKYMTVSTVAREIKSLTGKMKFPIFVGAQLKREFEGRKSKVPRVSDLSDSGELEKEADMVILIHRPGYITDLEKFDDDTEDNIAEFYIGKNRNGPVGKYKLYWVGDRCTFSEISTEQARKLFD